MQYTMNEDKTFGFQWDVDSRSNGFYLWNSANNNWR